MWSLCSYLQMKQDLPCQQRAYPVSSQNSPWLVRNAEEEATGNKQVKHRMWLNPLLVFGGWWRYVTARVEKAGPLSARRKLQAPDETNHNRSKKPEKFKNESLRDAENKHQLKPTQSTTFRVLFVFNISKVALFKITSWGPGSAGLILEHLHKNPQKSPAAHHQ